MGKEKDDVKRVLVMRAEDRKIMFSHLRSGSVANLCINVCMKTAKVATTIAYVDDFAVQLNDIISKVYPVLMWYGLDTIEKSFEQ